MTRITKLSLRTPNIFHTQDTIFAAPMIFSVQCLVLKCTLITEFDECAKMIQYGKHTVFKVIKYL